MTVPMKVEVLNDPPAITLQWVDPASGKSFFWGYCFAPGMPFALVQYSVTEPHRCEDCGGFHA